MSESTTSELPPSTAHPVQTPADGTTINEVSWWRFLLLLPFAALVRLWMASLRFRIAEEDFRAIRYADGPAVNILWHNRLFIAGEIIRRYRNQRRMLVLVSASRDGAWLTAFFKLMGVEAARGSSSRRGLQALRELVAAAKSGLDIGITPDGPRGPCYEIKPGALLLARQVGLPMVLISAKFRSAWRVRSWDRFFFPRPFSIVEIRSRLLRDYATLGVDDDIEAARRLRELMMELTTER